MRDRVKFTVRCLTYNASDDLENVTLPLSCNTGSYLNIDYKRFVEQSDNTIYKPGPGISEKLPKRDPISGNISGSDNLGLRLTPPSISHNIALSD